MFLVLDWTNLDGLGKCSMFLDDGIVHHEVLHSSFVYQEIGGSTPPRNISEFLTRSRVSAVGDLVALLGPKRDAEGVGAMYRTAGVKL